jgi:hypothetical protein
VNLTGVCAACRLRARRQATGDKPRIRYEIREMDIERRLLDIERKLWTNDPVFYENNLIEEALLVFSTFPRI